MPARKLSSKAQVGNSNARRSITERSQGPQLELNEEQEPIEETEPVEPIWRRLDDLLTTAQEFDVAGFGNVRAIAIPRRVAALRCCPAAYRSGRMRSSSMTGNCNCNVE